MTDDVLGALGDVPPGEMRAYLHRMADWIADYRETIETRAIVPRIAPGEVAAGTSARLPDHAEAMSRILDDLDTVVMPGVVHWGHPAFLGYFGSTSNGPALLGELAAAALNVSAMTWKTSPAATELEGVVLEWIRELIGLEPAFTGVVYDTASVATLHALAAAREVSGTEIRARGVAARADVPVHRVYTSDQVHSSVAKAMVVLGLGEENVVRIPTDDAFRLDAHALRAAMEADIALGFRPMAVVATIGTTSTASVDPVADIAELCRANGVWLHVDAAYGGAFAALPEGRWVMRGVEQADSFVVNPHKWLFVPLDFSALFTRHPDALRSVFSLTPEYLRGDATADGTVVNYMDYGIQLGRRFRALKAWMTFRALGRNGLVSRIREHCRLASLLADRVTQHPGVSLAAPPMMAIVCFRFEPAGSSAAETDALNEAVAAAVNASGMAYVTHTRLRGVSCVRVGIGNILTTERHVEQVWSVVLTEAQRLGALR